MPFPDELPTVTLTGHQTLADGSGRLLPVRIRPVPTRVVLPSYGVVVDDGPVVVRPDDAGEWSVDLLANDVSGMLPTGWTYRVETGGDALYVSLPQALGEVDIAELTPAGADEGEYVLAPGPKGDTGDTGPQPPLGAAGAGPDVALRSDDPTTTNPRTPTEHAASHEEGGSDPVTVTQDQVTGLAEALAARLLLTGGTLTGNLTVMRADGTGGYRFRVDGGGLNLDLAALDVFVSHFSEEDFTGTERYMMRWEPAGPHLIGRVQFGTNPYDTVHDIDANTGVAGLGARNSLVNARLAGRRGTAGPPTTGTWDAGDTVQDAAGAWWLCTMGGTPGTWVTPAAPGNEWSPADQGLSAWSFDPASCTGSGTTLSAGFIYAVKLLLRQPTTLNRVHAVLGTAGSGLTSGQCLAGYYDTAGNRLGVSADQSTAWASAGNKAMALTAPVDVPAGAVYAAFLFNGTTSPSFAAGSTHGANFTPGNAALSAGAYRFCRSASGQTSLPSTITLSGFTPDANNVWAGAS
ncbi:hypothetical protein [Streptomyces antibioticus]|uniref:hypothetical protein n=1 Tax=Streptomyces antibioticus TaxID=1890 RepID=UPI0033AD7E0D